MRVIDRIFKYIHHHRLSAYQFERELGIANGYLKKQQKGKGSVGSEILEKIARQYKDLDLTWLVTGNGKMLNDADYSGDNIIANISETAPRYESNSETLILLKEKVAILENALADKDKIILLLEQKLSRHK